MKVQADTVLLLILSFLVTGFTGMYEDEEPETLEWDVLADVEWVFEDNYYRAVFNEKQRKLDGKELIVHGFMFPIEYTRRHSNFIVSSAPMGFCFFCGPGEAESMVYVQLEEPVEYTQNPIKAKGTFKLVSDVGMGIIYELTNATIVR